MTVYNVGPVRFGGADGATPQSMVTTSLGPNDPEIGTVYRDGNKEYVFVYNAGGASAAVGHGVIISAVSGYSVTVSSVTDINGWCIGVVQNATFTTAAYGWVQTRGFGQVQMHANQSAAAGERLVLSTDGGFGRLASANTDVLRATPVAIAVSAIASGASGTAYIRTFF